MSAESRGDFAPRAVTQYRHASSPASFEPRSLRAPAARAPRAPDAGPLSLGRRLASRQKTPLAASCFLCSSPSSTTSPGSPGSSYWRMAPKTEAWEPGALGATRWRDFSVFSADVRVSARSSAFTSRAPLSARRRGHEGARGIGRSPDSRGQRGARASPQPSGLAGLFPDGQTPASQCPNGLFVQS